MNFAFLHGGGQGSWVWDQLVAAIGPEHTILLLDIPGCGTKRGRETAGMGIDQIADELLGDIEASALSDVVLLGHSAAGTILPAWRSAPREASAD